MKRYAPNLNGRQAILALVLSALLCGLLAAAPAIGAKQENGKSAQTHKQGNKKKGQGNKQGGGSQEKEESSDGEGGDSGIWSNVFPWASDGDFSSNWLSGLGLVLLGVMGALVTIYLFLGEFLPSMGGKAEYEAIGLEIQDLSRRRDKQLVPREGFTRDGDGMSPEQREEATKLTGDFNSIIERKEKSAQKVKRELVAVGFPLYVLLGGAFAVLFASNAPQAILIGFGWTAVADRFGLKRELAEKSRKRDDASAKLVDAAKEAGAATAKVTELEKRLSEAQQTAVTATKAVAAKAKQEEPK